MPKEKPLLRVGSKTLLERVVGAVQETGMSSWHVAVSPNTPATADACRRAAYPILYTSGIDYHQDVAELRRSLGLFFSVSCDLPFVRGWHLRAMLAACRGNGLTGVIPLGLIPSTRRSARPLLREGEQTFLVIGLNVVGASDESRIFPFSDLSLEVNVNTREDWEYAKRVLRIYERKALGKKFS